MNETNEVQLFTSPPRALQAGPLLRQGRKLLLATSIGFPAVVGGILATDYAKLAHLRREGRTVEGRIAQMEVKKGFRSEDRLLIYRFPTPEGERQAQTAVPSTRYESTHVGDPVTVTYLPSNPEDTVLDAVDDARVRRAALTLGVAPVGVLAVCVLAWLFGEWAARRRAVLMRDGIALQGAITKAGKQNPNNIPPTFLAEYEARTPDGSVLRGKSQVPYRLAEQLQPDAITTVLWDGKPGGRHALYSSLTPSWIPIEEEDAGQPALGSRQ